jgi:chloramphenicol O-acetyltransferase
VCVCADIVDIQALVQQERKRFFGLLIFDCMSNTGDIMMSTECKIQNENLRCYDENSRG